MGVTLEYKAPRLFTSIFDDFCMHIYDVRLFASILFASISRLFFCFFPAEVLLFFGLLRIDTQKNRHEPKMQE